MTYNLPVDTDVNVGPKDAVEGGAMAVVLRNVVVEDVAGVAAHGGAGEPVAVYREYLSARVPDEIMRQSTIARAFMGEPEDASPLALDVPPSGTVFRFDGEVPEWVLLMKDVTLLRARYSSGGSGYTAPGQPVMTGGDTRTVRTDVQILLWDNRDGTLIATGEVQSEERIVFSPSGKSYEAAVGEFVEKLIANTPLARRR